MVRKAIWAAVFVLSAFNINAQVNMPQPSPTQTVKQNFGIGSVEVTYSRPAAKGRKIFGDLVPFNKLWRTGANASTIIRFSEPVEMAGKKIDTGSYSLYTIPGIDTWTIILNRSLKNWGSDGYNDSLDVVRFAIAPEKIRPAIESFTIEFSNVMPTTCTLDLVWENTRVPIPLKADVREKIKAQLESAMQGEKKPYWQAVQFYNEYDNNPKKALEMANEAVKANPKAFWVWIYKAKLELATGNKAAALESSRTSYNLAKEAGNDDYMKMNDDFQKKLK